MERHQNVVEAVAVARSSGGLFRGTAAVLAREVPFYVLGMVGFEQLKRFAQGACHAWPALHQYRGTQLPGTVAHDTAPWISAGTGMPDFFAQDDQIAVMKLVLACLDARQDNDEP